MDTNDLGRSRINYSHPTIEERVHACLYSATDVLRGCSFGSGQTCTLS